MSIGENILKKRESAGMTQEKLGDAVGVTKSMICKIELGLRVPTLPLSKAIADVLGCTVDELTE